MVTCRRLKKRNVDRQIWTFWSTPHYLIQPEISKHTCPVRVLWRCPLLQWQMSLEEEAGSDIFSNRDWKENFKKSLVNFCWCWLAVFFSIFHFLFITFCLPPIHRSPLPLTRAYILCIREHVENVCTYYHMQHTLGTFFAATFRSDPFIFNPCVVFVFLLLNVRGS